MTTHKYNDKKHKNKHLISNKLSYKQTKQSHIQTIHINPQSHTINGHTKTIFTPKHTNKHTKSIHTHRNTHKERHKCKQRQIEHKFTKKGWNEKQNLYFITAAHTKKPNRKLNTYIYDNADLKKKGNKPRFIRKHINTNRTLTITQTKRTT